MYGQNPKNRGPVWPELDVDCPTCKSVKGQACTIAHFPMMSETTELPHNRRVGAMGDSRPSGNS